MAFCMCAPCELLFQIFHARPCLVAHCSPLFVFSVHEMGLVIGGHIIAGIAYGMVPCG